MQSYSPLTDSSDPRPVYLLIMLTISITTTKGRGGSVININSVVVGWRPIRGPLVITQLGVMYAPWEGSVHLEGNRSLFIQLSKFVQGVDVRGSSGLVRPRRNLAIETLLSIIYP